MTRRNTRKVLALLLFPFVHGLAAADTDVSIGIDLNTNTNTNTNTKCIQVSGTARLTPDSSCRIVAAYRDLPAGTRFLQGNNCYAVTLKLNGLSPKKVTATGWAGVTTEPVINLPPTQMLATPVGIPADDPGVPLPSRAILTARSVFTVQNTTMYTIDTVVIQPRGVTNAGELIAGATAEQVLVARTDGRGSYADYAGAFTVHGNVITQEVPVLGELCKPS